MKKIVPIVFILGWGVLPLSSQNPPAPTTTISARTAGMAKSPGYVTMYWDDRTGKIWFEIDRFDQEFLYYTGLPAGLGSNEIGLDRAQLSRPRIVRFHRVGPKILLIQSNFGFRADTPDAAVRRNVEDSFAKSVIAGFEVAAEEGGRVLIEATPFILRDSANAAETIARRNQGQYRVDPSRSAIYLPATKNFPLNTEIEAIVTLSGADPGSILRGVAPDAEALTFRMHHSFVPLPDGDFDARPYDPRSNFEAVSYMDFATPFSEPIERKLVCRFRLKKKDPKAPVSEAVKPIIYYVDRGIPEPIRTAVIEGASWWNQAFTAAGYKDAFQVRLLPEGVDPMDLRYNMINWVNRSTRGWSYGGGITDPRTGEILKAHASLGSLRIRQDYLIAEALVANYDETRDDSKVMRDMALARIRQLSAHEVGHTLGMGHNFASNVNDRASVMDYPHPLVKIKDDGTLDLSEAYAVGIGEWDKVSIAFAYQDYPAGVDEVKAGRAILDKAFAAGLHFLSGSDSGPAGAHPLTAPWDNGRNLIDELDRVIRIRSIALANFSEKRIRPWRPLATLEEVLVPAYLFHRYQTQAAAASLGGLMYFHKLRGDVLKTAEIVPPSEQRRALETILRTITPGFLAIDERILALIPPRPPDFDDVRELFPRKTGSTFDPLAAAETAAGISVALILNPARASRLVEYHARNSANPGLEEIIDRLLDATWRSPGRDALSSYHAEVQRVVDKVALTCLLELAAGEEASTQAGAIAVLKIDELKAWILKCLSTGQAMDAGVRAHWSYGIRLIQEFERDPKAFKPPAILGPPPGAPIG
jgi:hypothetical protein